MKTNSAQLILGIIIIIFGILALLGTTEILPVSLIGLIPLIFILLGFYALIKSRFRNITGPIFVIALFTLILLVVLDIITWDVFFRLLWPIIIIIIGIGVLSKIREPAPEDEYTATGDMLTFFGDNHRTIKSEKFQGVDITAIFGDVKLDLQDAEIKDSPARIKMVAIFSDVKIKVPENWNVRIETVPVLGDIETRQREEDENPDLIITGFLMLGDLIIRD